MFTVEQIKTAHGKVKTGADYPRYVQDLKKLGIHHYDYVVGNGSNVYYDKDGKHIPQSLMKQFRGKCRILLLLRS